MGCLLGLIGIVMAVVGFILLFSGHVFAFILLLLFAGMIIELGNIITDHIPLNKLFEKGDIVGKDLKYIEDIIGPHTSVDVSNNNARVYKWQDRLEIICDKNNVCKEVLKKN